MADATTLVKYLSAHSGYSRRDVTDLIKNGKVMVNSAIIVEPWHEVKSSDDIRLEGKPVKESRKEYFLLNKPEDYITTMEDNLGRQDVSLLMKGATKERIFPIGRLDKDTTGLLVFTNDGELAQCLSHPRFNMQKEYQVTLDKPVNPEHLKLMFKGLYLRDGKARVDRAAIMPGKRKYVVIIEIHSGKKHIIRRLFEHFGYEVRELDRISFAGLSKKGLSLGKWRALTTEEVESLKTMAAAAQKTSRKPRAATSKPRRPDGRASSERTRTDYRSSSRPKFRDGSRVERPELRKKKELIIGTEEWFSQDENSGDRFRSQDEHTERSGARVRTRPDREDSRASFRRSDSNIPKKDYSPKRPARPNNDRNERSSWREQRESSSDIESWFNKSDDAQPARSRSRADAPTRSRTDRDSRDDSKPRRRTDFREDSGRYGSNISQPRKDHGDRPSWGDKRESGAQGDDVRPRRRFDSDAPGSRYGNNRSQHREDRRDRPNWRNKRESGVEGEESYPRRRFDSEVPGSRYGSRSQPREDRGDRPSWRDKRESGVEGEDSRPRRRFDSAAPGSRYGSNRSQPREDRGDRPSWRDKRESGVEGEDAKPRTRSKPTTSRTTSSSRGTKSKNMVSTKPAYKRTKPGGGGKPKSRSGTKKRR